MSTHSLYILTGILGTTASVMVFPQVYKIFKRKSARDISVITYCVLFVACIIWILYGIQIGNIPLILTNSTGAINFGLIIIGWFLYGRD